MKDIPHIGLIPIDWDVLTLQEISKELITYGIVQAGPYIEDGVPYIKSGVCDSLV